MSTVLNILSVTGRSISHDFAKVSACSASANRSIYAVVLFLFLAGELVFFLRV
jgi:hypothetical protein